VKRSPVITGQDMRNARFHRSRSPGRWETSFTLSQDGGRRFERFTRRISATDSRSSSTTRFAVSLRSRAPSAIRAASTVFPSQEEASDLALVLRTGALPAGIHYEQERTVGPSLGADSIREGIYAGIAGLIAVIFIMLVYYKKAGINAVLALLLNTILLMAALATSAPP
jgi:preprotein translocase subunit SecD